MKNMYNDISARIFSIILVIIIGIATLFVLANGESFENKNNSIEFDYNQIMINKNQLLDVENKQLIVKQGINNLNTIDSFNLNFNQNIKFEDKKDYNVSLIIEFENLKKYGLNEFYIGFSEYSQVVYEKNYLEFIINNTTSKIVHKGDELRFGKESYCENQCELTLNYIINNQNDTIKTIIKINNNKEFEKTAILSKEFNKGFNLNNFWFTISKTQSGNFKIKKFEVEY